MGKEIKNRTTESGDPTWLDSLKDLVEVISRSKEGENSFVLTTRLLEKLRESGLTLPTVVSTPYLNTIPVESEPPYPGDREIERKIKSYVRWNALAMVVKANRLHDGIGGHISTYASCATLYEVGFNHFFRGHQGDFPRDVIYFQGQASPGNYARAYLERRIDPEHLHHFARSWQKAVVFRRTLIPYLMPDFWQFLTVSMGLSPILSIYQACGATQARLTSNNLPTAPGNLKSQGGFVDDMASES
jgi:pyruvate dehydrogenase E1 component